MEKLRIQLNADTDLGIGNHTYTRMQLDYHRPSLPFLSYPDISFIVFP